MSELVTPRPPRPPRPSKAVPDKAAIELMEPFHGLPHDRIITPATPEAYAAALAEIRAAGAVGFDSETKPVFTRGVVNAGPDVVQFATGERAFIFQLCHADCRPVLQEILEAEGILKIGFDLTSDRALLHRKLGVTLTSVVDLGPAFRKRGFRNMMGVRSAVALVLQRNFRKSKHVSTSNWSLPQLSPRQLEYAANDAFAALMVWSGIGCPGPEKPSRRR